MGRPRNAERGAIAQRRANVLRLRIEQRPYTEIAEKLGISAAVAEKDFQRALEQRKRDQAAQADVAVAREEAKLDAAEQAVWEVLRRKHITVQHGKIVGKFTGWVVDPDTQDYAHDDDGKRIPVIEPIEDDAPILQAVDRLVRIAQRRAALTGIDAPAKVEVSDARRAEIERLAAYLAAAGGLGDLDPAGAGAAPGDTPPGEGTPDPA